MKLLSLALYVISLSLFEGILYAQGTLVFNNLGPNDGKVFLFDWAGNQTLLNQDLNFSLQWRVIGGGPSFERKWLLSDGTAKGINVGPGLFADPSHSVISLSVFAPGETIGVWVSAWAGDYSTFDAALGAGAAVAGTGFFSKAGSIEAPPGSLTGFPELHVGVLPEPGIFTLGMIGTAIFLLGRFRNPRG